MHFREPRGRSKNPETALYEKIKEHLEYKGWFVQNIHGNKFQSGLPDMFISRLSHPQRWVELKTPARAREKNGGLSPRQMEKFMNMDRAGCLIYVLTAVDQFTLLYGAPNWKAYATGGSKIIKPKGF